MAAGHPLRVAAKQSGAGERTIKTWTATVPEFGRRVAELRSEMTSRALGRLADGMTSAADTDTQDYLSRKGKSEMVRLGAARAILELGNTLREAVELESRIAAVEMRQQRRRGR